MDPIVAGQLILKSLEILQLVLQHMPDSEWAAAFARHERLMGIIDKLLHLPAVS